MSSEQVPTRAASIAVLLTAIGCWPASLARSAEPGAGQALSAQADGRARFQARRDRVPVAAPSNRAPAAKRNQGAETDVRATVRGPLPKPRVNVRTKTLGGVQLWGDELVFRDWRIQRNALTGHCRLLDPDDRRHAWGSFEQCQAALESIKTERHLPRLQGRAVILLHGLGGWRGTMKPLGDYLRENSGFTVISMTYPSTRAEIAEHARALASVVDNLQGIEEINFVCHSLGNLVLRHYLADATDRTARRSPDSRIKRIVMLAPPNHGSERALKWSNSDLFVGLLGASAVQLGSGWSKLEQKLATPLCDFGIIAGGRQDDRGYSSRLAGDDDGTLSVATTRLAGARDSAVLPVWHSFMMMDSSVQQYTLQFLEEGHFTTDDERQPIFETADRRSVPR